MKSTCCTLGCIVLGIGFGMGVGSAQAGVAGWTAAGNIAALEATNLGRFTVRLDIEKNTSGCRDPNGFYVDYGADGSDLMYQTLLEAAVHERQVELYVTGVCDLKGLSGISSVRLRR